MSTQIFFNVWFSMPVEIALIVPCYASGFCFEVDHFDSILLLGVLLGYRFHLPPLLAHCGLTLLAIQGCDHSQANRRLSVTQDFAFLDDTYTVCFEVRHFDFLAMVPVASLSSPYKALALYQIGEDCLQHRILPLLY